jgi:hypothetical protein
MGSMFSDDRHAFKRPGSVSVEKGSSNNLDAAGGRESKVLIELPCEIADATSNGALRACDPGARLIAGCGFVSEQNVRPSGHELSEPVLAPMTTEMYRHFITREGCGLTKSC